MIRPLHPTDVVRYALFSHLGEANRVRVLDALAKGDSPNLSLAEVCREALSIPRRGQCLVWAAGRNLLGLGSARERSGPRSWEISQLFLSPTETENRTEFLEMLSQFAAERGAERVFLRTLYRDPLEDSCQRAGFFPYYRESLYRGRAKVGPASSSSPLPLRPRVPSDEHDLFRLYNAVVPHQVRMAVGLTMEGWRDSQEKCYSGCKETIYETNGSIRAWLRTTGDSKTGQLEILAHPEEAEIAAYLFDQGLRDIGEQRTTFAVVPEYLAPLQRLLIERRLERTADYLVMVKSMAIRVEEKSVAPTKAAPIQG